MTANNDYQLLAVPITDGKLCMHFGHCNHFALFEVDKENKRIIGRQDIDPPPHAPGLLPPWLAKRGVQTVIAGGIGQRAQQLFSQHGVEVIAGASAETPEKLIEAYFAGNLKLGDNCCDH